MIFAVKKIVKELQGDGNRPVDIHSLKQQLALETFVEHSINGHDIGCSILRKGRSKFRFVFGFSCTGLHPVQTEDEAKLTSKGIERLISAGVEQEDGIESSCSFHLESFSDDSGRQHYLDNLVDTCDSFPLRALAHSEKKRSKELTEAKTKQSKRLTIYVEHTVDFSTGGIWKGNNWKDKAIATVTSIWPTPQESTAADADSGLPSHEQVRSAYIHSFVKWEKLLSQIGGWEVIGLTKDELWARFYGRFHADSPSIIPQYFTSSEGEGLKKFTNSPSHPRFALIRGKESEPQIPIDDAYWVKVRNKYVGVMASGDYPKIYSQKQKLLKLWSLFTSDKGQDVEIVTQIRCVPHRQREKYLEEAYRKHSKSDLFHFSEPVNIATVLLVHADSLTQLGKAKNLIGAYFQYKESMFSIKDARRYWLQTLPFVWDRLCIPKYSKKLPCPAAIAPAMIPHTKTRELDETGFELIGEDGTPIQIDLINKWQNITIFGSARTGKTTAALGMITPFLSAGFPVVVMDSTAWDRRSPLFRYADYLGDHAVYVDIDKEVSNIMELPDLRRFDSEVRRQRLDSYKEFLLVALSGLIKPSTGIKSMMAKRVKTVVCRALHIFFSDEGILARYNSAIEGGFGSAEWEVMPTLVDFKQFCTVEALGVDTSSDASLLETTIEYIAHQLETLLESKLGHAISQPRSFAVDKQFVVFGFSETDLAKDEYAVPVLSAYGAALRFSLEADKSTFLVDDCESLLYHDLLAKLIARIATHGAYTGTRLLLSLPSPSTLFKSPQAKYIVWNTHVSLTGPITTFETEASQKILRCNDETISRISDCGFHPTSTLYRNWLVSHEGTHTFCRYHPSELHLAVTDRYSEAYS